MYRSSLSMTNKEKELERIINNKLIPYMYKNSLTLKETFDIIRNYNEKSNEDSFQMLSDFSSTNSGKDFILLVILSHAFAVFEEKIVPYMCENRLSLHQAFITFKENDKYLYHILSNMWHTPLGKEYLRSFMRNYGGKLSPKTFIKIKKDRKELEEKMAKWKTIPRNPA